VVIGARAKRLFELAIAAQCPEPLGRH